MRDSASAVAGRYFQAAARDFFRDSYRMLYAFFLSFIFSWTLFSRCMALVVYFASVRVPRYPPRTRASGSLLTSHGLADMYIMVAQGTVPSCPCRSSCSDMRHFGAVRYPTCACRLILPGLKAVRTFQSGPPRGRAEDCSLSKSRDRTVLWQNAFFDDARRF